MHRNDLPCRMTPFVRPVALSANGPPFAHRKSNKGDTLAAHVRILYLLKVTKVSKLPRACGTFVTLAPPACAAPARFARKVAQFSVALLPRFGATFRKRKVIARSAPKR